MYNDGVTIQDVENYFGKSDFCDLYSIHVYETNRQKIITQNPNIEHKLND